MKVKFFVLIAILLLPSFTLAGEAAKPIEIGKLQALKIDGKDERAVIKALDGKMQVVKPGDVLRVAGSASKKDRKSLRVVEIAEGRIVLEEKQGRNIEKIIVRLESGRQRLERVKKAPEKRQPVYSANKLQEQNGK
jgi:hypothetical protein